MEYAAVCLRAGDGAAYRHVCQRMAELFREWDEPETVRLVANAEFLGAPPAEPPETAVPRLERALAARPVNAVLLRHVLGLVSYRAGRWEEARGRFEDCAREKWSPNLDIQNELLLAMTCQHLGRRPEAQQHWRKAGQLMASSQDTYLTRSWVGWLAWQVLREEADRVVNERGSGDRK